MILLDYELDIDSVPGQTSFVAGSEQVRPVVFIAIVTEGSEEELIYIRYIKELCKEKGVNSFVIHCINDFILSENEKCASHPKRRLELIKEWHNEHSKKFGINENDKEWLICDRDDGNFKPFQYDNIIEEANKLGIEIIVSNPSFQLWLLFHFDANIEPLDLDSYSKSKDAISVIEKELKTYVSGYKHGGIDMSKFASRIGNAIQNSKKYSLSSWELKDNIGTNFSELLLFMEEQAKMTLFPLFTSCN